MLSTATKLENYRARWGTSLTDRLIDQPLVRAFYLRTIMRAAYADMEAMNFGRDGSGLLDDSPAYLNAEADYERAKADRTRILRGMWSSSRLRAAMAEHERAA